LIFILIIIYYYYYLTPILSITQRKPSAKASHIMLYAIRILRAAAIVPG